MIKYVHNVVVVIEIVNLVTSGLLNQKVNLNTFSDSLDAFDYDHESYRGGHLGLLKYTATLYSSSMYMVPGSKSIEDIPKISDEIHGPSMGYWTYGPVDPARPFSYLHESSRGRRCEL